MLEYLQFNALLLLRLLAAAVLGGLIGLERGVRHDAGLRTHILVCLGAASVMVISECLVTEYGINSEIMRMGAQVISGIGFLGAGSIIMDGNRVRGITTAAGLWATACVGIVVGSGYYLIAAFMVLIMLLTMHWLRSITKKLQGKVLFYKIKVTVRDRETLKRVLASMSVKGLDISAVSIKDSKSKDTLGATLRVKVPQSDMIENLLSEICGYEGVLEVTLV